MKKNFFLSFICACVPGAGQMYQNYMKRGVSLMGAFAAVCALSWAFNASVCIYPGGANGADGVVHVAGVESASEDDGAGRMLHQGAAGCPVVRHACGARCACGGVEGIGYEGIHQRGVGLHLVQQGSAVVCRGGSGGGSVSRGGGSGSE